MHADAVADVDAGQVEDGRTEQMKKYFLKPGFIFFTPEPCVIMAVVGGSVSISLWHPKLKIGGMNHFLRPLLKGVEARPSALFTQPATLKLVQMFRKNGVKTNDLEANIFGGAVQNSSSLKQMDQNNENIEMARDLLGRHRIKIAGMDVGGTRGRKILFNTGTGEVIVARVNNLREDDWYPNISY